MQPDTRDIRTVQQFAWNQRRRILDMALSAGADSSHLGGGLSFVDITATLFGEVMRLRRDDPEWPERDRFILSKGHGVLGYYSALAELGYIAEAELETFEKDGSLLLGHPVMERSRGVEFSTGSLGMGLSIGLGVALAAKRRGQNHHVYVLLGDGECNEGSIWEAAMAAPNHGLSGLTCIVDRNGLQQTGSNDDIMALGDARAKFESFGWDAFEVDGHDVAALLELFRRPAHDHRPRAVIAHTVKGKGLSFAENDNAWHHKVLTRNQYDEGLAELEASRVEG